MTLLINEILKLSRINRAEMRYEQVNLSEMAVSIFEELKASDPERRVDTVVESEMVVQGDQNLLRVALTNLLNNAWKYTGKCEKARIEFGLARPNGKKIYFIKDNGAGFSMQYADKLFQPFQRLHTSKDYPGTGIGLTTVQRVIQRHNGRVWAESEVNKGAVFYFTLG